MQKDAKDLAKAGIQVVAVSYDDVAVLARFGKQNKIKFPLLSDPGSSSFDDFGILNKGAKGRADGVPFPGTFLIGTDGLVRAKLFYEGVRRRHQAQDIVEAAKEAGEKLYGKKRKKAA